MAFDLATAEPVAAPPQGGGFDLASARPVGAASAPQVTANTTPAAAPPPPESPGFELPMAIDPLGQKGRIGLLETIGSIGSGVGASALGGIAGLARTAFPGPEGAGADLSNRIREGLTYQPRSEVGKQLVGGISAAMQPLQDLSKSQGSHILEKTGSPLRAAASETAIANLPLLLSPGISARGAATAPARFPPSHPKVAVPNELMDKGIKLTPSYTENTSKIGRLLEGAGGKAQTQARMSQANEATMNEMAASDLGLPPGTPINKANVKPILDRYGALREQIDQVSATYATDPQLAGAAQKIAGDQITIWAHEKTSTPPAYKDLFDALQRADYTPKYLQAKIRSLRDQAADNLGKTSGDTQLGNSQKATAKALEDFLERRLSATHPDLVPAFRDARVQTAKVYDYLDAASQLGDVNAPRFASKTEGDKLTGGAKDIATMGATYPKVAQTTAATGGYQPHTAMDTAMAAGSGLAGKPTGVLEFLTGRPIAREILTSKWGQEKFVRPSGAPTPPSTLSQATQVLKNNPAVASIAAGPFTDAEKERRYQEWKRRQKETQ